MRKPLTLIALAPALAAAVGCAAAGQSGAATASAGRVPAGLPQLPPPNQFVRTVDNPWFPLRPGTVLTYEGRSDGHPARDVFRVTRRTKTIAGIRATVIDDRVYTGARLEERTTDWYAQDRAGNVWYLGEQTATLDSAGRVKSREGSWRTGVRGARPGSSCPATRAPDARASRSTTRATPRTGFGSSASVPTCARRQWSRATPCSSGRRPRSSPASWTTRSMSGGSGPRWSGPSGEVTSASSWCRVVEGPGRYSVRGAAVEGREQVGHLCVA